MNDESNCIFSKNFKLRSNEVKIATKNYPLISCKRKQRKRSLFILRDQDGLIPSILPDNLILNHRLRR